MKKWLGLLCFLLVSSLPSIALQDLHFNGFIADEANILSEQVENDLNMTLWDLQKKSGADIAVVTLQSLNGKSVEDVAIDVGRTYKIGSREKNNGVVFLTSLDEHRMRIEIGTGLENKISMSVLNSIRDEDILPYYKQSNYEKGIARGTYMLANYVAELEGVKIKTQGVCPSRASSSSNSDNPPFWVYLIALILAPFSKRGKRFNSSGFGGFGGGGGFGGCGCSGSW